VICLLADANIQGHIERVVAAMQTASWKDLWISLQLRHLTFTDVGLNVADTDAVIWHRCQERQVFLLTNNRNKDGADSLEATIRNQTTLQSLPVFTIGNVDRVLRDSQYRESVVEALYDYLMEVENIRGTGRLYLP